MRHGKKVNHLSRKAGHRKALLKNMANSLIEHKRINTTLAKARALRKYVEPLITKAKSDTTHSRRVVFSYLQNKESVKELFGPIAVKVGDRPGGYIRIIKTGFRMRDGAEMAIIELVDFNEVMLTAAKDGGASKGKKRRTRRGGSKKTVETAAAVATPAVAEAAEEIAEEVEDETTEETVEEAVVAAEVTEGTPAEDVVEAAAEDVVEDAASEEE